ncbi:hypothetical protein ABPG72_021242 [Tetrahymena utriculariae]
MDNKFQGKQNIVQSVFNHQAIGFDVDHCLIRYKVKALTKLCYKVICQAVIEKYNYPSSILDLTEGEYGFALNYLVIHIDKGIVLRIAENKEIIKCYRGFTEQDVETEYGPTRMLPDFDPISSIKQNPQYIVCATYFENVIPLIFAKMTQFKCEQLNSNQLESSEYHTIFVQIIEGLKMNYQHFDQHKVFPINQYGRFFRQISENPGLYMFKQNQFRTTLENLKSQGKVLFIVTNSHYEFMNLTMTYSYGEDWMNIFDFIFVKGGKPEFFNNPYKQTFLLDMNQPLLKGQVVNQIVANQKIYVEGNYTLVEQYLQQKFSSLGQILYIGDHIMNDCYFTQKYTNWDGIAIVEELFEQLKPDSQYRVEAEQNIISYRSYWGNYLESTVNNQVLKNYWYSIACKELKGVVRTLDCLQNQSLWS